MAPRFIALLGLIATLTPTLITCTATPVNDLVNDLLARQAEASCHRDCGRSIVEGQGGTEHCTNATYVEQLNRCLACGDTLPEGYEGGIASAAEPCDFDAAFGSLVPVPGGDDSAPSETGSATSATGTAPTSTAAAAPAEVTNCHAHGDDAALYCQDDDGMEWEITSELAEGEEPESLMECEEGDSENTLQCVNAEGGQVDLTLADEAHEEESPAATTSASTTDATSSPAAETGSMDSAASLSLPWIPSVLLSAIVWLMV